jgi:hypothetical protein
MTTYIDEHPGGRRNVFQECGTVGHQCSGIVRIRICMRRLNAHAINVLFRQLSIITGHYITIGYLHQLE